MIEHAKVFLGLRATYKLFGLAAPTVYALKNTHAQVIARRRLNVAERGTLEVLDRMAKSS